MDGMHDAGAPQRIGRVLLVGAGPGSADLMTLRGARAVRAADVLLCDDLLPRSFLDDLGIAQAGKAVVWLGDDSDHRSQEEINALMEREARAGRTVARVKCGDPFVFGRGAEEVEFLAVRGIPWEVVPGVSSCLAAPTAAGLSLTRRGEGRSFAVATAREAGGRVSRSFPRADSLVVLMGAGSLEEVAERLLDGGWPSGTPATLVERAEQPWTRCAEGTLGGIAEVTEREGFAAPVALVVGVAARSAAGYCGRPRVLFTGLDPANFRALGEIVHWPALEIVPDATGHARLPSVAANLEKWDFALVIFTSRVGARSFLTALPGLGRDARLLAGAKIIAAGPGTAVELAERGLVADVVPDEPGSPGLLLAAGASAGAQVLVVQGAQAPRDLAMGLEGQGWKVRRLSLHRVRPHPELGRGLPGHDVAYFASPSGVRAFWSAYGRAAFRRKIWCIGETTRRELAGLGIEGKIVPPGGLAPEHPTEEEPAHSGASTRAG